MTALLPRFTAILAAVDDAADACVAHAEIAPAWFLGVTTTAASVAVAVAHRPCSRHFFRSAVCSFVTRMPSQYW
jgi:hypothetical protein